jgi:hypothetical protein
VSGRPAEPVTRSWRALIGAAGLATLVVLALPIASHAADSPSTRGNEPTKITAKRTDAGLSVSFEVACAAGRRVSSTVRAQGTRSLGVVLIGGVRACAGLERPVSRTLFAPRPPGVSYDRGGWVCVRTLVFRGRDSARRRVGAGQDCVRIPGGGVQNRIVMGAPDARRESPSIVRVRPALRCRPGVEILLALDVTQPSGAFGGNGGGLVRCRTKKGVVRPDLRVRASRSPPTFGTGPTRLCRTARVLIKPSGRGRTIGAGVTCWDYTLG